MPCGFGNYSIGGVTSCTRVPAGFISASVSSAPTQCVDGTWSPGGLVGPACYPCSPGYWCTGGATSGNAAAAATPKGYYYNPAQLPLALRACPAGTYGSVIAAGSYETGCFTCPSGQWCASAATDVNPSAGYRGSCSAGYYCPPGTRYSTEFPCPAGTYNPAAGSADVSACIVTPAGTYAAAGAASPVACAAGFYCPAGTSASNQYPCPAGYWSSVTTATHLSNCTSNQCPVGRYCPSGSASAGVPCPMGTYNPSTAAQDVTACRPCDAGVVCAWTGLSAPNSTCAAGFYCPQGTASATQFPCLAGTYYDLVNATKAADCWQCPAGSACPQGTGGTANPPQNCSAGYYCPVSTQYSTQFPCPAGSYTPATNLTASAECTICPAGSYCEGGLGRLGGRGDTVGACAAGYYCPVNTSMATQYACPAGSYSPLTNLTASTDCMDCPTGSYCIAGSSSPAPCLAGTYSNRTRTQQATRAGTGYPECTVCPAGYSCASGTVNPVACTPGYYSAANWGACKACDAGYACDVSALSQSVMLAAKGCAAGLFCPTGTSVTPSPATHACPLGYYCPVATPLPISCDPGTYANVTGLPLCIVTPAGYFSVEGAVQPTGPCSPGYYCPAGSSSSQQQPCPGGTYLPTSGGRAVGDCVTCSNGTYCPRGSAAVLPAPQGTYALAGSEFAVQCPLGRFGNITGARNELECSECLPGMYCDRGGLTTPSGKCTAGFYCTRASPISSPSSLPMAEAVWVARLGFYGDVCPRGGFCPSGAFQPTPCPAGSYLNTTGETSQAGCLPCTPGHYW